MRNEQKRRRLAVGALLIVAVGAACEVCGALDGGDGLPCDSHRACRADQVCSAGHCVAMCRDHTDCAVGERCVDLVCSVPSGDAATADAANSDAAIRDALATDLRLDDHATADRGAAVDGASDGHAPDTRPSDGAPLDAVTAADARADAVGTDVDGAQVDASVPCSCLTPDDVCEGGHCYLSGFFCSVLNLCAAGYACTEDNRCRCSDRMQCGTLCQDDTPCAAGERCYGAGLCMVTIAECFGSVFCQADEWCDQEMCEPRTASTRPPGSTCAAHEECASGLCVTHVCVSRCNSNSDCANGLVCQLYWLRDIFEDSVGGCILPGASECGSECGSSQICEHGYCGSRLCRRNSDCPGTGTCRYGGGMISPTECEATATRTCADGELVIDYAGNCSNGATCHLSQDDCEFPYRCDDLMVSYTYRDTGVCILP